MSEQDEFDSSTARPCIADVWLMLDNECDAAQPGAAAGSHLDECGSCLEAYGIEEKIKLLVSRKCGGEQAPERLRQRLADRDSPPDSRRAVGRRALGPARDVGRPAHQTARRASQPAGPFACRADSGVGTLAVVGGVLLAAALLAPTLTHGSLPSSSRTFFHVWLAVLPPGATSIPGAKGCTMAEDVRAEMVSTVYQIVVAEGDEVEEGDTLVILESMKMEIPVLAESRRHGHLDRRQGRRRRSSRAT